MPASRKANNDIYADFKNAYFHKIRRNGGRAYAQTTISEFQKIISLPDAREIYSAWSLKFRADEIGRLKEYLEKFSDDESSIDDNFKGNSNSLEFSKNYEYKDKVKQNNLKEEKVVVPQKDESSEISKVFTSAATREELCKTLVAARKEQKMSQKLVAKNMGVSPSVVSELETGQTNPTLDTLKRYSDAINANLKITVTTSPSDFG